MRTWSTEQLRELLVIISPSLRRHRDALAGPPTSLPLGEALDVALALALRGQQCMLDRRSFALLRTMFLLSCEQQLYDGRPPERGAHLAHAGS
jgi:hypothetical protein